MDLDTLNTMQSEASGLHALAAKATSDAEAIRTVRTSGGTPLIFVKREDQYGTSREHDYSVRRREVMEPILSQYIPHIYRLAEIEFTSRARRFTLEAQAIEATIAASIL